MFWTITVILLVLWVLGMAAGSTVGLWVHLMLVFALVTLLLALVGGSRRSRPVRGPSTPLGVNGAGR